MKIKHLTVIRGNHDQWFFAWLKDKKKKPHNWLKQGGYNTLASFKDTKNLKPYLEFFERSKICLIAYFSDNKRRLFIHGGVDPSKLLSDHTSDEMMWDSGDDRILFNKCKKEKEGINKILEKHYGDIDEIYIGHSSTERYSLKPINYGKVWCMDQGSGWGGCLSIMDIQTKDFWTSHLSKKLYPNDGPNKINYFDYLPYFY